MRLSGIHKKLAIELDHGIHDHCGPSFLPSVGRNLDQIKAEAAEKGDLGLVAESSRTTQGTMFAPPKLDAASVFGKLQAIGRMTGSSVSNG